jgi:hypothetical protein
MLNRLLQRKSNFFLKFERIWMIFFRKLLFDFDLFAMGTNVFFTDDHQTLEQCGLVPNATLGIREIKRHTVKK